MLMNTFQRRQFSNFLIPFIRDERSQRTYGVLVDNYMYSHGTLNVALSKWMHTSMVMVLSPEYIGVGPLEANGENRAFTFEELPKDGDYRRGAIVGEYTSEIRNRNAAHGLLVNLATS